MCPEKIPLNIRHFHGVYWTDTKMTSSSDTRLKKVKEAFVVAWHNAIFSWTFCLSIAKIAKK
jgi:hypothetical protein